MQFELVLSLAFLASPVLSQYQPGTGARPAGPQGMAPQPMRPGPMGARPMGPVYNAAHLQVANFPTCFQEYYELVKSGIPERQAFVSLRLPCIEIIGELVNAAQLDMPAEQITMNVCMQKYARTFFIRHWMGLLQKVTPMQRLRMTLLASLNVDKNCLIMVHKAYSKGNLQQEQEINDRYADTCAKKFIKFLKDQPNPNQYFSFIQFSMQKNDCGMILYKDVRYFNQTHFSQVLNYLEGLKN